MSSKSGSPSKSRKSTKPKTERPKSLAKARSPLKIRKTKIARVKTETKIKKEASPRKPRVKTEPKIKEVKVIGKIKEVKVIRPSSPPPNPTVIIRSGLLPRRRVGRGFSLVEVAEAGLDPTRARNWGLFIDSRRSTKHSENVDLLKNWLKSKGKAT